MFNYWVIPGGGRMGLGERVSETLFAQGADRASARFERDTDRGSQTEVAEYAADARVHHIATS